MLMSTSRARPFDELGSQVRAAMLAEKRHHCARQGTLATAARSRPLLSQHCLRCISGEPL